MRPTPWPPSRRGGGPAPVPAAVGGRELEPLRLGYVGQCISLGRRDGLVPWVDRADRAKRSVLTGRSAAVYKNTVTGAPATAMRLERRFPGATRWPGPPAQRA